ncbi:hypothetical protein [Paenibacillus xylanexedens]|uniref:hypothetical protein n=1 Tax=Paenibacillus xylanexedens TaxID=528191 RepID=UPI0016431D9C|nr:hypothetical protein [Paenibacillus xylanexedens]
MAQAIRLARRVHITTATDSYNPTVILQSKDAARNAIISPVVVCNRFQYNGINDINP